MYDKVVAPNVSISAALSQNKDYKPLRREPETSKQSVAESEIQARSTKHKSVTSHLDLSIEEQERVDQKYNTESSNRQRK